MRLLFARQQEEIRIVKKSVTVLQIETGSPVFGRDGAAVIELQPEIPGADRMLPTSPSSRASSQQKESGIAVSARADHMTDCVDLHVRSTIDGPGWITYAPTPALRVSLLTERYSDKGVTRSQRQCVPQRARFQAGEKDDSSGLLNVGRPLLSDVRVCKFIAVQEMTEDRSRPRKKALIDIEV